MEPSFESLALGSWAVVAAVSLILIVARRFVDGHPAIWHAAWCLLLFKLVSPLSLWWVVSLPWLRVDTPVPEVAIAEPPIRLEAVAVIPNGASVAATFPSETAAPIPLRTLIFAGVIGIGVANLLRQMWHHRAFRIRARRTLDADAELLARVREVAAELAVAMPDVRVWPGLPSPMVGGLRRGVLYWPLEMETALDPAAVRGVLFHELAHLKRKDGFVRLFEMAVEVFHWWNPLFWLIRGQIHRHAEEACDRIVIEHLPGNRRDYAEAILHFGEGRPAFVPVGLSAIGVARKRELEGRLKRIMLDPGGRDVSRRGRVVLCLVAAALLPGWLVTRADGIADVPSAAPAIVATEPRRVPQTASLPGAKRFRIPDAMARDLAELIDEQIPHEIARAEARGGELFVTGSPEAVAVIERLIALKIPNGQVKP